MLLKLDIGLYISFLFLFSSVLFVTYMHTYIHSYIHTYIDTYYLTDVKESNFTTLMMSHLAFGKGGSIRC
jgi:hypothetical protein